MEKSEGEKALGRKGGMDLNKERGAKISEGKGARGQFQRDIGNDRSGRWGFEPGLAIPEKRETVGDGMFFRGHSISHS